MGKTHRACCSVKADSSAAPQRDAPDSTGRSVSGLYNCANTLWFLSEKFSSVFEGRQELRGVKGRKLWIRKLRSEEFRAEASVRANIPACHAGKAMFCEERYYTSPRILHNSKSTFRKGAPAKGGKRARMQRGGGGGKCVECETCCFLSFTPLAVSILENIWYWNADTDTADDNQQFIFSFPEGYAQRDYSTKNNRKHTKELTRDATLKKKKTCTEQHMHTTTPHNTPLLPHPILGFQPDQVLG